MIDPLESRILLVGSIFNGVLRIVGGASEDFIPVQVGIQTTTVTYIGATQTFLTSAYNSILVEGGEGNDWIHFSGNFNRPGTINGGAGNDTIFGSQQIETLNDGPGNDVIYYQLGDVIDPQGPGSDEFFFGTAPPQSHPTVVNGVLRFVGMFGGNGRDYLVGGAGTDLIPGENGVDQILAKTGEDDFRASPGDLITLV